MLNEKFKDDCEAQRTKDILDGLFTMLSTKEKNGYYPYQKMRKLVQ